MLYLAVKAFWRFVLKFLCILIFDYVCRIPLGKSTLFQIELDALVYGRKTFLICTDENYHCSWPQRSKFFTFLVCHIRIDDIYCHVKIIEINGQSFRDFISGCVATLKIYITGSVEAG